MPARPLSRFRGRPDGPTILFTSAALCLTLSVGAVRAQQPATPTPQALEDQIVAASKEWFGALIAGDVPALERLETDDFVTVQQGRGGVAVVNKSQQMENLRKSTAARPRFERDLSSVQVREYGNVAILTALATYRQPGPRAAAALSQQVITEVWVSQGSRWRIAHFQPTEVPVKGPSK